MSNNRSVPLIAVDPTLLPNKNRVDVYRTLIGIAIKEKLPPLPVVLTSVERLAMFIPPILNANINLVAEQHKLSFQEAFAGLTAAGIESLTKARMEMVGLAATIKPPFADARPEQTQYFQGIQAGISLNKIVLAEASTGVGKGRVICAAAIEAANEGKKPVLIAAPTLKVLGQLWGQMDIIRAQGLGDKLTFSFFPGATEFVNEVKLIEFMSSHDKEDKAVEDWIKRNGSMLESKNPLRVAMGAIGVKPAWLMDDLRALVVNMPAEDFALRGDDECETARHLKDIRNYTKECDIIFCTHAMLAHSQKNNWTLLPEPAVLVIDEAHQFEHAVASAHSDSVSLFSLRNRITKEHTSSSKAAKAINSFINYMRDASDAAQSNGDILQVNLKTCANIPSEFRSHIETILNTLSAKANSKVANIQNDRRVFADALRAIDGEAQQAAYLSFSPDRRFPSIMAGKSDIRKILGGLWKAAHGGAILASATLHLKDSQGNNKNDYIADILALPGARTHSPMPVIASWVTTIPVLYTPDIKDSALCEKLARPSKSARDDDSKADAMWLGNLTGEIEKITRHATGGTLVLCTSYHQVTTLAEGLAGANPDRIIMQQRNKKLSLSEMEFRDAHKKGLRPVWIALGGAWTGLDLSDEDANVDTLLTDLVITCCPIGLNRTTTMNARIEARSMQPVTKEALMLLKQGLGRLMRDEKQKNRNIWFLDGRIWTKWSGLENFQSSVKMMLNGYKNRRFL